MKGKRYKQNLCANLPNWIMAFLTLILIWGTLYYQGKDLGFAYRPYVGIVRIVKIAETNNELLFETEIKNTGDIPANNIKIEGVMEITNIKQPQKSTINVDKPAILFPEVIIKHKIWLRSETLLQFMQSQDAIWKIKYLITYDGIHTKHHKTVVEAFFDKETKSFHYENGYAN